MTTCSDFLSEAMLWIKEVEMVDSMDELKSCGRCQNGRKETESGSNVKDTNERR